jgi:hypothetical protein
MPWPNHRDAVAARGHLLSAFRCQWPGATHSEL